MSYGLTRRSLLRGLGAAAVALPALEATEGRGQVDSRPKRFVLMYAGMSTGNDRGPGSLVQPATEGPGYELPRSLLPLGATGTAWGGPSYDVQDETTVVTGLEIPWGTGSAIPPGGKSVEFHYNTAEPQTTGVRRGPDRSAGEPATSADVLAADALGETTHQLLSYRVQAARYIVGGNASGGGLHALSLRRRPDGSLQRIDAISSPRLAYESLFSTFVPDDGDREDALRRLQTRRDVLTAVRARTDRLARRLGAADRQRLEQHLHELNQLQMRLAMTPEPTAGACMRPMEPGDDPPIADGHETQMNGNLMYTPGRGWSDETLRGEVMVDMVKMAFACDLVRSVGFRITLDQTFLNAQDATGHASDMHETTHGGAGDDGCRDSIAWHVAHFARLVRALKDTPEVDGSSLLDHTAVVLLFEGGFGHDPESGSDERSHSTENMSALVAGHVGGLAPAGHVRAIGMHPANVVASALSAVGLEPRLGEIDGRIDSLFG